MTFRTLIQRSLRFHWRSHLGVVLGAAVGGAALIGALVVGDSVRWTLRERALTGIGSTRLALVSGDRFFRDELATAMGETLRDRSSQTVPMAPALLMQGAVSTADGSARANRVQVVGVDERFWQLSPGASDALEIPPGKLLLNEALATHLGARPGDTLVVRIPKPTALTREFVVTPKSESTLALRYEVHRVVGADEFGNFSLRPSQLAPFNVFIPLAEEQERTDLAGRANLMLLGGEPTGEEPERYDSYLLAAARTELNDHWRLADAQLELRTLTNQSAVELRTPRVFLDEPAVAAALAADAGAKPILTLLANLIRAGTNSTPYSMITAAGPPWTPESLRDDEVVINQWLADDLQVKPGDEVNLTYFDPETGARLLENSNTFRVHSIVPMEMPWADRTLMPQFPGIEKAESTHDWDGGFPLVHKIRDKDEDYWREHRGTPKAFVTLAAGQKMWGNRFGEVTSVRFSVSANVDGRPLTPALFPSEGEREVRSPALAKAILANLEPEELGLRFEPVREHALLAAAKSQDFGGLFLGFSFFLIIAALLLMAMLFQFGLEQRIGEVGTLLALGFTPKQVRRLLLGEGVALAFVGAAVGALGGIAYARAMLHGLTTVWSEAVAQSALNFHVTTPTLAIGFFSGVMICVVTIWLTMRKFVKRPARELLAGEVQSPKSKVQSRGVWIGTATLAVALGMVGWALATGATANAGMFFAAGALVLIAGLSFLSAWLGRRTGVAAVSDSSSPNRDRRDACPTLVSLGVRNCARRRKRSLSTAAMLACGSFLIMSIGVFRLDANRDAHEKSSGTGGFELIGETTISVVHDLNSPSGREFFALDENDVAGVSFVPFRVHEGDDASCLNLAGAQRPRLLGVKPELLEGRFTFAKGNGWHDLLDTRLQPGDSAEGEPGNRLNGFSENATTDTGLKPGVNEIEIPAIGDVNSIQWAMHKKVGDTIDYVDERGRTFKVRIVGAVANSILQGSLIVDEAELMKRFPGAAGHRMFLIDAPTNSIEQASAALSRAMQDMGLELIPAAHRLAQFNAVQNTYLGTFQVLGGLGLLLGSVGLGIIVLRNVLERRGELAVLLAVGFRKFTVRRLLLVEHGALLGFGLGLGIAAAAVAVLPSILSPAGELPYGTLGLTLAAVLANGFVWTWLAARVALRGDLLAALRNE